MSNSGLCRVRSGNSYLSWTVLRTRTPRPVLLKRKYKVAWGVGTMPGPLWALGWQPHTGAASCCACPAALPLTHQVTLSLPGRHGGALSHFCTLSWAFLTGDFSALVLGTSFRLLLSQLLSPWRLRCRHRASGAASPACPRPL